VSITFSITNLFKWIYVNSYIENSNFLTYFWWNFVLSVSSIRVCHVKNKNLLENRWKLSMWGKLWHIVCQYQNRSPICQLFWHFNCDICQRDVSITCWRFSGRKIEVKLSRIRIFLKTVENYQCEENCDTLCVNIKIGCLYVNFSDILIVTYVKEMFQSHVEDFLVERLKSNCQEKESSCKPF
jgi:hypothetical protein